MTSTTTKKITNQKGQGMVELALALPLFLAFLFGTIEIGRAWYFSAHLLNSVRAAARYGAVLSDTSDIKAGIDTYLRKEIGKYMPPEKITGTNVEIIGPDGPRVEGVNHGDTIIVSVEYNFTVLSGSIVPALNGDIRLNKTASMNYE
ncbi:MAG TPA: TadE/TadG family type IV pilus assembly protein [Nitrospirota bacterium]|jgi:Flp pilus assembly protein TadG